MLAGFVYRVIIVILGEGVMMMGHREHCGGCWDHLLPAGVRLAPAAG